VFVQSYSIGVRIESRADWGRECFEN